MKNERLQNETRKTHEQQNKIQTKEQKLFRTKCVVIVLFFLMILVATWYLVRYLQVAQTFQTVVLCALCVCIVDLAALGGTS